MSAMMFEVTVESSFRASHAVRLPTGEMEPIHEHDWQVSVIFVGTTLNDDGMLIDFELVRERLLAILAPLRGSNLNDHPALGGRPASAERVARRIFELLDDADWSEATLRRVTVREAPGCAATFCN